MTRLSVNINKIALLRNARGENLPDVLKAALEDPAVSRHLQGKTVVKVVVVPERLVNIVVR